MLGQKNPRRILPLGHYPSIQLASLANPDPRIKVLVADAVPMSCRLLADALQRSKRFQADSAIAMKDVFKALVSGDYEVLLISSNLSDGTQAGGLQLLPEIQRRQPHLTIVVLLDAMERKQVLEAFRAGARGVFCRTDSFQALCKCIVRVNEGQVWASSAELEFVVEELAERPASELVSLPSVRPLSRREEEIARLVAEGLSNRQISQRLALSEHTIKNYLFRVFEKVGVTTRVELALYALNNGHVPRTQGNPATRTRGTVGIFGS